MGVQGVNEYEREALILSRPPAILKVNCPEGAREGGLGHWVLSHRADCQVKCNGL